MEDTDFADAVEVFAVREGSESLEKELLVRFGASEDDDDLSTDIRHDDVHGAHTVSRRGDPDRTCR